MSNTPHHTTTHTKYHIPDAVPSRMHKLRTCSKASCAPSSSPTSICRGDRVFDISSSGVQRINLTCRSAESFREANTECTCECMRQREWGRRERETRERDREGRGRERGRGLGRGEERARSSCESEREREEGSARQLGREKDGEEEGERKERRKEERGEGE